VGTKQEKTVSLGSTVEISITVGGEHNIYQWFKDGSVLAGGIDSVYSISSMTASAVGTYTCEITNYIVPELTLYTRPIRVSLDRFDIKSDSLALVALYHSTDGSNWTNGDNWLSGPVSDWYGITVVNNRVVKIDLHNNNLVGPIPEKIGDLNQLSELVLVGNQISGAIPNTIGNLVNLTTCALDKNRLTGNIPAEIKNLKKLTYFILYSNSLSGLPDLSLLSALSELHIQNNKFTFEDIEPNIGVKTFVYSPQDSVGIKQDTTITAGDGFTMSAVVGGSANQYQWFKDGEKISSATDSCCTIMSADSADQGVYYCHITNTIAPDLTLFSRSITVHVSDQVGVRRTESSVPQNYALYPNFPNPFNSTTTIRFDIPKAGLVQLEIYNLEGRLVETVVGKTLPPGKYSVQLNGHGTNGLPLSSGVYLYILKTKEYQCCKKLTLLR